jgi:hypothetical protein
MKLGEVKNVFKFKLVWFLDNVLEGRLRAA